MGAELRKRRNCVRSDSGYEKSQFPNIFVLLNPLQICVVRDILNILRGRLIRLAFWLLAGTHKDNITAKVFASPPSTSTT